MGYRVAMGAQEEGDEAGIWGSLRKEVHILLGNRID